MKRTYSEGGLRAMARAKIGRRVVHTDCAASPTPASMNTGRGEMGKLVTAILTNERTTTRSRHRNTTTEKRRMLV